MLWRVVLQKPIVGKNIGKVTDTERLRARRVFIVDAPSEKRARDAVWPNPFCVEVVSVERIHNNVVVLAW